MTILDEVILIFDAFEKSDIPMRQIYSQIKKIENKMTEMLEILTALNHTFVGVFWTIQEEKERIYLR